MNDNNRNARNAFFQPYRLEQSMRIPSNLVASRQSAKPWYIGGTIALTAVSLFTLIRAA